MNFQDRLFLQSVIDGHEDFYDKDVFVRLVAIAESSRDDADLGSMIQRAKTIAQNWLVTEFQKKIEVI